MEIQPNENAALPPGYEGLTFEKVWATLQENARQMREQREEADRRREEADRQMKEQRQETERQMREQREESERQMKERRQETERQMKERHEETERLIRQNQKMLGDLGRKLGTIVEHMFIPNLKEKFNAMGYIFEKSSPNVLIESKEHNIYMEIDVFLENGDYALAVEVKTQANIGDIREHIGRMKKLRRYFDLHGDKRTLHGAVAAAIFPGNVHDFALKQGFYIINQMGDNINIEKPQDQPKAW